MAARPPGSSGVSKGDQRVAPTTLSISAKCVQSLYQAAYSITHWDQVGAPSLTLSPFLRPCNARAYVNLIACTSRVATASVLAAAGDMVAQLSEVAAQEKALKFDFKRLLGMCAFGAIYTGVFQGWWMDFLAKRVRFANHLAGALVKTWLCQFGSIPLIYMPTFFFVTGAFRGEGLARSAANLKAQYLPLYARNVCYWIPVQTIQFLYIARDWHVPFLCAAGFA